MSNETEPPIVPSTSSTEEPPKKKKRLRLFNKKRPFEENYDADGNFLPRKRVREEVYSDYYGPLVVDEKGHKAGKFFFIEYEKLGRPHVIGEIILGLLLIVYFAYGGYNLYYAGGVVRDLYSGFDASVYTAYISYLWYGLLILALIYVFTLVVSYIVVRLFHEIVAYLMFLLVIIQIALLVVLYYYIDIADWDYNWVFLVAAIPNVLVLTLWYPKFKTAIYAIRMSTLTVAKQREILLPQITQTIWIVFLGFFHLTTSFSTFFEAAPFTGVVVEFSSRTLEITDGWIYFGYSCLFVFLVYVIYMTSQSMKMLMIHNFYRGGKSMGFRHAYRVMRRRWWGIVGYAFTSTIIHMLQSFAKMLKKATGPQNIKEVFSATGDIIPGQVNALKKKKGTPWYERVWMGLNIYTLPAITIENRTYFGASLRSLFLIIRDIPSLYIKAAHTNALFWFIKYSIIVINGMLGFVIGYFFADYFEMTTTVTYIIAGGAVPVFIWVAGGTSTLIVNDLNNAYITIMFIHTIDELNKKKHYTLGELQSLKGDTQIVPTKKEEKISRREEKKRKREEKKKKTPDTES